MWRVFEFGFVALIAAVFILFIAPLVLKTWEAYCGWIFRNRT